MISTEFTLSNIRTDFQSLSCLANFHKFLNESKADSILLKFDTWFGANMCSPLGGILNIAKQSGKQFKIEKITDDIESILSRNYFLNIFGIPERVDHHKTTIPYLEFQTENEIEFLDYINNRLLSRSELPNMTKDLVKKIAESIFEIFNNAKIHSESNQVFCCGQFFPRKNTIEFSITDIGIGIKNRIQKYENIDIPAEKAIQWAMIPGNSTKRDDPGGLGLALLLEFTQMNRGAIQIASDEGYYSFNENYEKLLKMDCPFPGTCINMKFRTDDTSQYCLTSELDSSDIF